jgi:hypothetical protein
MRDTNKFIICLIQDYCNKKGHSFESEKFALAFGAQCTQMFINHTLTIDSMKQQVKKYKSFILGNELDVERFSIEIMREICDNEIYIPSKPDFHTAISQFKIFVEGTVYPAFQVTKDPQEEIGRSLLQTYLHPRGFRESQMSGGNSDLVYPVEETIVETKIWRDTERYKDGIVELSAYLDSQGYNTGYYVLFDNTQSDNCIVTQSGSSIFDIHHDNHLIHCVFVKIKPIAPSKRRRPQK